jgi:hypothetical protein
MLKDKDRTPVAQDIIAMCTKCKMELNHVVISHNIGGVVDRVKCHTCGSEHKYRPGKKTSATKSGAKKVAIKKTDPGKDFQMLSERLADKAPSPYKMSELYNNDDVIEHSIFGKGIVINTYSQKMEVVFADGSRILAMDRK